MPNLLAQIQSIDDRTCDIPLTPFQEFIPIEPRSLRRKKARDAAKASQTMRSRPVSNNSINQK